MTQLAERRTSRPPLGCIEPLGRSSRAIRAWAPTSPSPSSTSRHHDEGLKQIEVVIKQNPEFQAAHLNKGIFLQTEAREAKDKAESADYLAEAKLAYRKAVSIDPASDAGKHAAEALQSL